MDHQQPFLRSQKVLDQAVHRLLDWSQQRDEGSLIRLVIEMDLIHCSGRGLSQTVLQTFLNELRTALENRQIPLQIQQQGRAAAFFVAPLSGEAGAVIEQELVIREVFEQIAEQRNLCYLPIREKICWTITDKKGKNRFDSQHNLFLFLFLLTALLRALYQHGELLQALSGEEVIDLSRFPFAELEAIEPLFFQQKSQRIEGSWTFFSLTPVIFSLTALHAIVADSLQLLLDEVTPLSPKQALLLLRNHFQEAKKSLYQRVGPPLMRDPLTQWINRKTVRLFEGILSEEQLQIRYHFWLEQSVIAMERRLQRLLKHWQGLTHPVIDELRKLQSQTVDLGWEAKRKVYLELIEPKMARLPAIIS